MSSLNNKKSVKAQAENEKPKPIDLEECMRAVEVLEGYLNNHLSPLDLTECEKNLMASFRGPDWAKKWLD
jgi:hypothetical protein